jgi:hypothetical protein
MQTDKEGLPTNQPGERSRTSLCVKISAKAGKVRMLRVLYIQPAHCGLYATRASSAEQVDYSERQQQAFLKCSVWPAFVTAGLCVLLHMCLLVILRQRGGTE